MLECEKLEEVVRRAISKQQLAISSFKANRGCYAEHQGFLEISRCSWILAFNSCSSTLRL
jgi:hypothetical protein